MKVLPTRLKGLVVLEPKVFKDTRGFFLEYFRAEAFAQAGVRGPFVQDNHSRSVQGTLRGFHGQLKKPQGKLVRVATGEIFDVAVDVRPSSPTFGQWEGWTLSEGNFRQMYVPPGFLHGFCVLSPTADVEYKCTEYYDAADEIGLLWNDPEIGVKWPIADPILSEKDKKLPKLADLASKLESYRALVG
jgi:dTDP-4-dehydrorhamnose 3,5-epimerase